MRYANRHVVVLGAGLTGLSLARYLAREGAIVRVADTRDLPPHANEIESSLPGVKVVKGPFNDATFAGADMIAISPGIAKDQPLIESAVAHGAELVGDIELFARALPPDQKVLAITGSNGKTTVTALTGALCRAAGLDAVVAGNIGEPVLDVLAAYDPGAVAWPDVFVLELSSFQLETTSSLRATAAAVLNVTDNHLDRYADIDDYARTKARIFAGGGVQVLNRDDMRSIAMRLPGRLVQTFGAGVPESEEAWGLVDRGARRAGGPELWLARGGTLLMPVADLRLVGRHNALNALAALALASTVEKIDRPVLAALGSFEGLPHRMQRIADVGGVLFVNDSKGTTVAATRVALAGLGRPVILIAGGDGKGQDFAPLRAAVDAHCPAVLLIGRDAAVIERALAGTMAKLERVGALDAAVARAIDLAQPGDAVLLSPACASLDQFTDYIERGQRFVELVRSHFGENAHA